MMDYDKEKEIVDMFLNPKTKVESTFRLAEYIVNKYNIITIGEKNTEIFVYQDGMYVPAENLVIDPEIQRILSFHVTGNAKAETYHKITSMTYKPREIFENIDLRYIPLKNGVYDLRTKSLLAHSPEFRFTYQLNVSYDLWARCPETERFLDKILLPEQRILIEEWSGYCLYRNYQFKKAMILVGEGDTGKTTLLEVIRNILGKENVCDVSLHSMSSDKFSAVNLYKKHGNIVDELSDGDVTDTNAFKKATGNGSIAGERKYGNQFSFTNYAKFLFACNKTPDVSDMDDDAYFNRWMVLTLGNHIPKNEQIKDLSRILSTEVEKSGFLNIAIKALERILEAGLTYDKTGQETKMEMMRSGSSIAQFASAMLSRQDGVELTKAEMYEAYSNYCTEHDLGTESEKMLGTKLGYYCPYLVDGQGQRAGKKLRLWRNGLIKGTKIEGDVDWGDFKNLTDELQG